MIQAKKDNFQGINWYHCFKFPDGSETAGHDRPHANKLKAIFDPVDFKNKTVLDVCTWDGFYAFESERLGAKAVVANDYFCWSGPGWGTKRGFDTAKHLFESKVIPYECELMDINPNNIGQYDIVLFLGVLYHRIEAFRCLEICTNLCKDVLVIETLTLNRPECVIEYLPQDHIYGDTTNQIAPTVSAVVQCLLKCKFRYVTWNNYSKVNKKYNRTVFHAYINEAVSVLKSPPEPFRQFSGVCQPALQSWPHRS